MFHDMLDLRQTHLQEIDMTQILEDHINNTTFGWESRIPQIHGHDHGPYQCRGTWIWFKPGIRA